MNILFDQGTPQPLKRYLGQHKIETVYQRGWSDLKNGDLLEQAEQSGFDLLITTDQNLRYQQNLAERRLAILVLTSTSWPRIKTKVNDIYQIVTTMTQGSYQEVFVKTLCYATKRILLASSNSRKEFFHEIIPLFPSSPPAKSVCLPS